MNIRCMLGFHAWGPWSRAAGFIEYRWCDRCGKCKSRDVVIPLDGRQPEHPADAAVRKAWEEQS